MNRNLFTQKKGICIGSADAPVLPEVFLRSLGVVESLIDLQPVGYIYVGMFVDNILV